MSAQRWRTCGNNRTAMAPRRDTARSTVEPGGNPGRRTTIGRPIGSASVTFRPRVLVPALDMDLSVELLGETLFTPIVVGPVADQRRYHAEGELATARGAAAAHAVMIVSSRSSTPIDEMASIPTPRHDSRSHGRSVPAVRPFLSPPVNPISRARGRGQRHSIGKRSRTSAAAWMFRSSSKA